MKKCSSVLLIDDNEIDNLINSKLIKELDISEQVIIAANGEEGLNYLVSNQPLLPSLVFLDLNMPGMNGFEFLEQLTSVTFKHRDKIKVVVLTSSLNENDYEEAKTRGCDGYLVKPLTADMILDEFEKVFYYEL
jgi:CheY-like chemotaxis protein